MIVKKINSNSSKCIEIFWKNQNFSNNEQLNLTINTDVVKKLIWFVTNVNKDYILRDVNFENHILQSRLAKALIMYTNNMTICYKCKYSCGFSIFFQKIT